MRWLRLSLVGMAILALLAGSGTAALAEDDYSRSGVWMDITGEEGCWNGAWTEFDVQASGDYQVRGIPGGCELTASDPRLSGTWTWELNEDCFADGGCVNWGPVEVKGPDGAWSGWSTGSERPDAETRVYLVLLGSGAYEGLTHVEHWEGPFTGPFQRHGVTYEGDPPPMLHTDQPAD